MAGNKETTASKKYDTRKSGEIKEEMEALFDLKFQQLEDRLFTNLKQFISNELGELTNHLFQRMDDLVKNVSNNKRAIELQDKKFKNFEENYDKLCKSNSDLASKLLETKKELEEANDRLEDQTNRQMRKTLVFTNIAEGNEEEKDVTSLLQNVISKVSKGKMVNAKEYIERAHRGKKKRNGKGGPRPIYAAVDDWRHSEAIKGFFLDRQNDSGIYCDQMYGPRTTWRRSQALRERKELKQQRKITKGYVAFPARLMVLKPGEDKYILWKDYSNLPVIFGQ